MTVCWIIHVFCKSCEPEIVFVLICPLAEQFHVHRSYKTCVSTMSYIRNFEENIGLSDFHLAANVRNFGLKSKIYGSLIVILNLNKTL